MNFSGTCERFPCQNLGMSHLPIRLIIHSVKVFFLECFLLYSIYISLILISFTAPQNADRKFSCMYAPNPIVLADFIVYACPSHVSPTLAQNILIHYWYYCQESGIPWHALEMVISLQWHVGTHTCSSHIVCWNTIQIHNINFRLKFLVGYYCTIAS